LRSTDSIEGDKAAHALVKAEMLPFHYRLENYEKCERPLMMQGPRRVVNSLLSVILLSAGFLDYWEYSRQFHQAPGTWNDVLAGTANAPAQYRIGVVYLANFLARHLHVALRYTLTLMDVAAIFVASFTLWSVLRRSAAYRSASLAGEWFGAAAFVLMVEFYLAWLLWYQRPETLTSAALLALALLLLTIKRQATGAGAGIAAGLVLLAVAQGFVRADIAFALHVGILLVCLTPLGKGFALPRTTQIAASAISLALVLGIQYTLMHKIYPQATYGDTKVLQLFSNMTSPSQQVPFLLFLIPFLWTLVTLARRRYDVGSGAVAMLTGAVVFLGMWMTVGRIQEVRIFMPYGLALIPLTVELAMLRYLA
jgi:hypothetical protein